METSNKFMFVLLNSTLTRNLAIKTIINRIIDNLNILLAFLGFSPGFVGQTRLAYRAGYFISKGYEKLRITCQGICSGDMLIDSMSYPIQDFIPVRGIPISGESLLGIKKSIRNAVSGKDTSVSRKYFRLRGVFKLVVLGTFASISVSVFQLITDSSNGISPHKIINVLWLFPNLYFFTQTILFYFSRLKHFSLKYTFEEASA
ncbi:MAG TPA: hypothetical protein VHP38_11370, partial [Ruminiclostridium sp.]|nr:hypothetical protein [Ruminiclostridium sp.]